MSFVGILGALLLAWLVAALVPFNLRRIRLRKVAQQLPLATRRRVLELIDGAGAVDGTPQVLLRLLSADSPANAAIAKLASLSAAPGAGELVGTGPEQAERWLAEVHLQSPPLPAVWADRCVSLWLANKGTHVLARSAGVVAHEVTTPSVPASPSAPSPVLLGPIRLPQITETDEEGDRPAAYSPGALLRRIPGLRDELGVETPEPERVLAYVLAPDSSTYEIDTHLVHLMGGQPECIQDEHKPVCVMCAGALRFLLQLGDGLGIPGDAPVVYVYGCDTHTDQVVAFIDIH